MGMVFQHFNLFPHMTILKNLTLAPMKLLHKTKEEAESKAMELLRRVALEDRADAYPSQLSGGQKQRIAIAGILACNPEIVVFDESTAMLDPVGRAEVIATIETLNREYGTTVVLITHYMEEAARAGRVVVIDNGKKLLDGTPKEVFKQTKILRGAGLDVPQTTLLLQELADMGYDLPRDALTPAEGAEALAKILSERGK